MNFTTTADALAAFEAQGVLSPGTEGFWKVWGAGPHQVKAGDLVLTPDDHTDLILDTFEAKAYPARAGWVTEEGRITYGALAPLVVLRWGDRNTLA